MGQIFEGHVHPLKVVKIKNPFGILQTNTQIPQDWVGFILFLKKHVLLGHPIAHTIY